MGTNEADILERSPKVLTTNELLQCGDSMAINTPKILLALKEEKRNK